MALVSLVLAHLTRSGKPSGLASSAVATPTTVAAAAQDSHRYQADVPTRWRILSTLLHLLNPGQAIQQALTTGRYKDSMDRLMLGVAVGFRLGRDVTLKMAASALAMQEEESTGQAAAAGAGAGAGGGGGGGGGGQQPSDDNLEEVATPAQSPRSRHSVANQLLGGHTLTPRQPPLSSRGRELDYPLPHGVARPRRRGRPTMCYGYCTGPSCRYSSTPNPRHRHRHGHRHWRDWQRPLRPHCTP